MTPDPKNFSPYAPNPIFNGLPEYLKDPQYYEKIEMAMIETLSSKKTYSDLMKYIESPEGKKGLLERRALIKRLGFKSTEQYMSWRKVMRSMLNLSEKKPLAKYNKDESGSEITPIENEERTTDIPPEQGSTD